MKDQPARSLVLRNVRIVLPERTSEAANVLIEDGRIVRIFDSSSEKAAKADSLIDLDGLTLFPGFIDVHYEGPFVNSEQCGALHRDHFRTFKGLTDVDALPTINHESAIHMMTLAPEIDGGIELIKELKKRNWIVSIGHTCATTEVLDEALAAGAHHMTHFMNAMTPLHHRAPGPVEWGLLRDEVTCDVIADGVHRDPAILKLILRNKS